MQMIAHSVQSNAVRILKFKRVSVSLNVKVQHHVFSAQITFAFVPALRERNRKLFESFLESLKDLSFLDPYVLCYL